VIRVEAVVLVTGRVESSDEGTVTLMVEKVGELDGAIQQKAKEIIVRLPTATDLAKTCDDVKQVLEGSRGECEVFVEVISNGALVRMRAHPSLKVQGSTQLEAALRNLGCDVNWDGYASPARVAVAGAQ
jgi:DNA polymerase III alpha subunit